MNQYIKLTKRNCQIFIRDRGAIFFSLLSMIITLILMGVFLGKMNVENVTDLLKTYGGARDLEQDKENARHLVEYWTLAGILVINAVTVTMAVMSNMVQDFSEKKTGSFYSTPVKKSIIALSYVTSSVILGMFLCVVPFVLALLYITAGGGEPLSFSTILKLLGCMALNVLIFSVIMYLLASLVKSRSAWSGLGTIIGTLVGFAGGVYLSMNMLPDKVGAVLKCLPILHGTSLMRKLCCEDILAKTFHGLPEELLEGYEEAMGITAVMGDSAVSMEFQVAFLLICGMIALGIAAAVSMRRRAAER